MLAKRRKYSWATLENTLARAQENDSGARDDLFRFLREKLLAVAKRRIPEEAEDVVHESLIILDRRLTEFRQFSGLLVFAHQVLRHKIGNLYQHRQKIRDSQVGLEEVAERPYHVTEELNAMEMERIIRGSIEKIGQRRPACLAILLALYEGFNPSEISARLGISKATLKIRTFRCRETLRRILQTEYGLAV